MQIDDVKNEIRRRGFSVEDTSNDGFFIKKETIPGIEELVRLIEWIPAEKCIFFWNYYHVTVTDPGSYVTAVVLGDHAVYQEGNHGWSNQFQRISLLDLAELIQKNWDKDWEQGRYLNCIEIKRFYHNSGNAYLKQL